MQAFGEGLVSARVGLFNKFCVYCGAAGRGQLSFEICGPDADTATSMLSALPIDQVYVLPAAIDEQAGVVYVNYKVSARGAPPCHVPVFVAHIAACTSTSLLSLARIGFYVLWIYFNGVPIPSAPFVVRAVLDSDARLQHPVRPVPPRPAFHCELLNRLHQRCAVSRLAEDALDQVAHHQRAQ